MKSPYEKGTGKVPKSDHTSFRSSSDILVINFCNVRGLHTNSHSTKHQFFSVKFHLHFITESLVCKAADRNHLLSVPLYFTCPKYGSKVCCCIYSCPLCITCPCAHDIGSSEFFLTIWLRFNCNSLITCLSCLSHLTTTHLSYLHE